MTGGHESPRYGPVQPAHVPAPGGRVHGRHVPSDRSEHAVVRGTAQFIARASDDVDAVFRRLGIHAHRPAYVVHHADGRYEQRGRYSDGPFAVGEFVVEAVLPRDKRRAVGDREVVTGPCRADQRGEPVRFVRIPPAEVVQQHGLFDTAPDAGDLPERFVDGGSRHPVRIDVGIGGVDAVGHGDALVRCQHGTHDRRVPWPIVPDALQGLEYASALYLVVVLPYDPFLARHIPGRQQPGQAGRGIGTVRFGRFGMRRRVPTGLPDDARHPPVQKFHVQVRDGSPLRLRTGLMRDAQPPVAGELADLGDFHVLFGAERAQGFHVLGRDGQDHAFLGFREKDLPRFQPAVFQGRLLQVHFRARGLSHFTDGRREPAGAAVGDVPVELAVPCLHQDVEDLLLLDGVADLNGLGGGGFRRLVQLDGRKRGPVDPVPARPSADGDDEIPGFD